jgi:beta-glucosidase
MHHVLLGHGRAIGAMRALGMRNLGAVCNFEWAMPADDSPEAASAARRYDGIYNRFFLSGIFRGAYPDDVLEGIGPHLPAGWQDDLAEIGRKVDWLGANYYTRKLLAPADGPWPACGEVEGPLPKTAMGWEVYPEGLLNVLRLCHEHAGGLPIYVTENGMAADDVLEAGAVTDPTRTDYVEKHLGQVRAAIAEGIPVAGYYVWSLMDNYEWALGYGKRFGIVHVDFETMERTPKASFHALSRTLAR